jgi:hypothetical protein
MDGGGIVCEEGVERVHGNTSEVYRAAALADLVVAGSAGGHAGAARAAQAVFRRVVGDRHVPELEIADPEVEAGSRAHPAIAAVATVFGTDGVRAIAAIPPAHGVAGDGGVAHPDHALPIAPAAACEQATAFPVAAGAAIGGVTLEDDPVGTVASDRLVVGDGAVVDRGGAAPRPRKSPANSRKS